MLIPISWIRGGAIDFWAWGVYYYGEEAANSNPPSWSVFKLARYTFEFKASLVQ
ncbi:MAG: hypothetical protein VXZ53_19620 [Planctomycetota bacterium]|nr:hypothetical protein [Planctomycetota bacterium]